MEIKTIAAHDVPTESMTGMAKHLGFAARDWRVSYRPHESGTHNLFELEVPVEPLTDREVDGLLRAPLGMPGHNTSGSADAMRRLVDTSARLYRSIETSDPSVAQRLRKTASNIHAVLDVLEEGDYGSWERVEAPLYPHAMIEASVAKEIGQLPPPELAQLVAHPDLPPLPLKRLRRTGAEGRESIIADYMDRLPQGKLRQLTERYIQTHYTQFDVPTVDDGYAAVCMRSDQLPPGARDAPVYEVQVYPRRPLKDWQMPQPSSVNVRTAAFYHRGRPVVTWVSDSYGRAFDFEQPTVTYDLENQVAEVRDGLLGAVALANVVGLDADVYEDLEPKARRPQYRPGLMPYAVLKREDMLLDSTFIEAAEDAALS